MKVPLEIVTAINAMLSPYGESFTPGETHSSKGYLNAREAHKFLGVSKSFLYKLINQGVIKPIKLNKGARNGMVVFALSDLESYINSCKL